MFHPHLPTPGHLLCIGAHSDDIEIGCGGLVLKMLRESPGTRVTWLVLSGNEVRQNEARTSAKQFLAGADQTEIIFKNFRDAYFPYQGSEVKDYFQSLAADCDPDLILTHRLEDRHQDHRLVAELTWNAFRNHLIYEYEIPKYEGDLGQPNLFAPLEQPIFEKKVNIVVNSFASQRNKQWFSSDTFYALGRIRGLESQSEFAEGFVCRKMII